MCQLDSGKPNKDQLTDYGVTKIKTFKEGKGTERSDRIAVRLRQPSTALLQQATRSRGGPSQLSICSITAEQYDL